MCPFLETVISQEVRAAAADAAEKAAQLATKSTDHSSSRSVSSRGGGGGSGSKLRSLPAASSLGAIPASFYLSGDEPDVDGPHVL